ncbi:MAG: heme ABC transporter ATP-binding protein [Thermoplasmata archaeon]
MRRAVLLVPPQKEKAEGGSDLRLSIENLSISFDGKKILKDISLDIEAGEFLALMGPNGSGKTTLLRCIMNYLRPEHGAVLIDAKPIHTLKDKELAQFLAVVPQTSQLDFTFTAYEIVMMGRLPYSGNRFLSESRTDADAVRSAMERTDTWRFADRQFSSLSGGERQRVVIARALAQEPKILLLDEPTVFLDITGQFEIMDLLRELNKEGLTIIAVLHDINLASRYCRRVALLGDGRIESIGSPDEVFTPENIMRIYDIDVIVRRDFATKSISVIPKNVCVPPASGGPRVHVLCGGGSGGEIIRRLIDEGFSPTAGVVNVLDSDYESARTLHVPVVTEVPFAQISDEAHQQNLRLIADAEDVILADFPVGPGNVRNVEAAAFAIENGKRVIVVSPESIDKRDFVGNRAARIIEDIMRKGAYKASNASDIINIIKNRKAD